MYKTKARAQHIVSKLKYLKTDIVFQEVPNEISLCFTITGCKLGCKGCHSVELWDETNGESLDNETFMHWLNKYTGLISCVLFMGGEWQPQALIEKLKIARTHGLKTCLYSGQKHIPQNITHYLDYLKTGDWNAQSGGLNSPTTNQIFQDINTAENLNHLFLTQGNNYVAP